MRSRSLILLGGKPSLDMGIRYAQPAPSTTTPVGEVNADEEITVDYGSRTWSDAKNGSTIGNVWNPAEIRAREAAEGWTVTGPVQFDGHQALELNGQNYHLWVDAQTYLPLRAEISYLRGITGTVVINFRLLPATQANLALVNPVIPPGFTQVPVSRGPSSASPSPSLSSPSPSPSSP